MAAMLVGRVALALLLAHTVTAQAAAPLLEEQNETSVKLPVSVTLGDGSLAIGEMLLTTFKPPGPGPFPIAIINHGRAADRSRPERFRMVGIASYLVRQGFAVFVPTRLGYGGSVLPPGVQADAQVDPEDSGDCRDKDYPRALGPAVQQITRTLNYARQLKYVDPSRHLLIGHSTGGFATVAYAATNPPGLIGYVNFAGGVGGNPSKHPGTPCQPERLTHAYAEYGKTTRVPSLWIYAENDQYFAPRYSRAWHRAFASGGSPTQLVMQPPFSDDGHKFLNEGLTLWRPLLDNFLGKVGIHAVAPPDAPVASGYAAIHDTARVPWLTPTAKAQGYAQFLAATPPRAFAISEAGYWGWANGPEDPSGVALAHCNRLSPKPCVLYAVDSTVVWRGQLPPNAPGTAFPQQPPTTQSANQPMPQSSP
jgi:dienelactone hydrolase